MHIGGYRTHNHSIYSAANVATSISVLPGLGNNNLLPAHEHELIHQFPIHSNASLTRADILLSFRLIGLNTINLLQAPYSSSATITSTTTTTDGYNKHHSYSKQHIATGASSPLNGIPLKGSSNATALFSGFQNQPPEQQQQLRLSILLEAIHKGRIILRNMMQAIAFLCVAVVS
jgi:hypothetical protein